MFRADQRHQLKGRILPSEYKHCPHHHGKRLFRRLNMQSPTPQRPELSNFRKAASKHSWISSYFMNYNRFCTTSKCAHHPWGIHQNYPHTGGCHRMALLSDDVNCQHWFPDLMRNNSISRCTDTHSCWAQQIHILKIRKTHFSSGVKPTICQGTGS